MTAATSNQWFEKLFPENKPVILLQPNFTNQHLLLESILSSQDRTPVFVSLTTCRLQGSEASNWLVEMISEQLGQPTPKTDHSPQKVAQTLSKLLKTAGGFNLVIDDVDLADEFVQQTLIALANTLPEGSQMILGGRHLPLIMLHDPSLKDKLTLFPIDPDRMLIDYSELESNSAVLEVYGLGPGRALINGRVIDRWDGMLPRSLFFYLIDRGMVTRDEIFQTFWPSLSVREATNVFHVTKRKISEILGFDLTIYWSGFYRISPDVQLHYDVVNFAENVQNSVIADDNTAMELLEKAIYLYRGGFMSSLDNEWARARREELESTYAEGLSTLGKLKHRVGDNENALGLFLRASRRQPHREDLARGIMSLFAELGQPQRALDVYERLSGELRRTLGVQPDKKTTELAVQIRQR